MQSNFSAGKLAIGAVLVVVGLLSFFARIDVWDPGEIWRFWPLILIFLGLSSEFDAFQNRHGAGGGVLLGVGVWMLAGTQHLFGLTIGTAFPLALVVIGISVVAHALVGRREVVKENS